MSRPRVLIADDHRIVGEGLRGLLEPWFELAAIVEDGQQLVDAATRLRPDVIVADISMPRLNGLEAIDQLRRAGMEAKVVFLTMHRDATYAARALQAGAAGFVLKHSASSELVTAIQEALAGRTYLTPAIASLLKRDPTGGLDASTVPATSPLTPRQREVAQLYAEGYSAKEIAAQLGISTRTAENHKAHIMSALGLSTTAELVQYAMRHGLIGPE